MIDQIFQSADWKNEKHVPVIECPDSVTAGEMFEVQAAIGKEISHPNTTDHHIRWIQLYFKPDDGKFAYHVGSFEFAAHGESTDGPDTGPVYTDHAVVARMKIDQPGAIIATSYCNIHGLWHGSKQVKVS